MKYALYVIWFLLGSLLHGNSDIDKLEQVFAGRNHIER